MSALINAIQPTAELAKRHRVTIIGNYQKAKWHPFTPVVEILSVIWSSQAVLTFADSSQITEFHCWESADVLVLYQDSWPADLNNSTHQELNFRLRRYLDRGGNLIVLHFPAISESKDLVDLVGARFISHPPIQLVEFRPTDPTHPIMKEIQGFKLMEELYCFSFWPGTHRHILMEMQLDNVWFPAAWTDSVGDGRVFYLASGHTAETFSQQQIQQILRNALQWMLT